MATIFNMLGLPEEEKPYIPAPLLASFQKDDGKKVVPGTTASKKTKVSESEKIPMNEYQPTYSKQFDEAFHESMGLRKEDLEALKQRLASTQEQKPTGLQALDLKPFAGFADYLTGSKTAQNFGEPKAVERHMAEMQRLEKAVRDDSNSVSDDQLNYLKLKAQEEMYELQSKRMAASADRASGTDEDRLRRQYMGHPLYKNMAEIDSAYQAISTNPGMDGPSQQALVYQYSKLLDPGSVVRETEYAMSAANAGKLAQARNYLTLLQSGKMLEPEQVALMKEVAMRLAESARGQLNSHNQQFAEIANRKRIDPRNVILDPFYGNSSKSAGGGKVTVTNGVETLTIDAADLQDAIKDGYKQVK